VTIVTLRAGRLAAGMVPQGGNVKQKAWEEVGGTRWVRQAVTVQ